VRWHNSRRKNYSHRCSLPWLVGRLFCLTTRSQCRWKILCYSFTRQWINIFCHLILF
jgi:hypothetical protein